MENDDIFLGHLKYLRPFCIFCVVITYIFSCFGMLHQEKYGNPGRHQLLRFSRK
jgi:hypothetical protein